MIKVNTPQNPNDPNKIPKDLQKLILQRSANQERETAKKLLNKNGYYSPESNTKVCEEISNSVQVVHIWMAYNKSPNCIDI